MGTSDDRWGSGTTPDAPLRALFELLTSRRGEIAARWDESVRQALGPDAAGLADPVSDLLDRVSAGAESAPTSTEVLEQGGAGEDLVTAVTRTTLLRDAVMAEWQSLPPGGGAALRLLDQALDRSVLEAALRAAAAHARNGRAFERLASAARQGAQPEALLRILLEESSVIDGAAVLVKEGDDLRVVAAAGVGASDSAGRVVPRGQGFPALVLGAAGPLQARWGRDPLGPSGGAASSVYGLPLPDGAGVAYLISLTAGDFPEDDVRLLRVTLDHLGAALSLGAMRAELEQARAELEGARAITEANDQALGQFAHDLRTPLGVVLMQAGAMLHANNSDDAGRLAKRAATLQRSSLRMQRLLGDFVDFHEARAEVVPLVFGPVDPAALVRGAADAFRAQATLRRIVLETELSPGLPPLRGDADRLGEVLAHLLRAALENVADGGRIALRALHDARGVVFSVDDDGPALDREGGGEIFERAARGERLISGRSSLGLAVVKSLVEQHGGRVWSAVASGNSLCFDLPTARA